MPRKQKLTAAAVRKIYTSREDAKALAARYAVSTNTIYLIRQGRRRQDVTGALTAPRRGRGRGRPPGRVAVAQAREGRIDIDALADAILNRLVARLRGR